MDRLEREVARELDRLYTEGRARLNERMTAAERRERDLRAARSRGADRRRYRRRRR